MRQNFLSPTLIPSSHVMTQPGQTGLPEPKAPGGPIPNRRQPAGSESPPVRARRLTDPRSRR
jgi:hypothetical protein